MAKKAAHITVGNLELGVRARCGNAFSFKIISRKSEAL